MAGKFENSKRIALGVLLSIFIFAFSAASLVGAQSTNLDFPTPVSTNQILGKIRARDLGDSRLTSHYYIFETGVGDVLLNIETSNLNGDIDIYTAGSLKPLLKASVYATGYATVMQRQVYTRLPSRLILRVEGRTPNDDPANYAVRFAGEFKAVAASSVARNPGDPKVSGSVTDGARARVNSAGTIIEEIKPPPPVVEPKKTTPKDTSAKTTTGRAGTASTATKPKSSSADTTATGKAKTPQPPKETPKETAKKDKKDEDAVNNGDSAKNAKPKTPVDKPKTAPTTKKSTDTKASSTGAGASAAKAKTATKAKDKPKDESKEPADPLAKVELVVEMKDGSKLKFVMTEVLRVNVDRGVVTIVLKNGDIERLSLLDIEEMKIGQ